jgi:nuclear transport factor 2 (NTF2) superfamily protein
MAVLPGRARSFEEVRDLVARRWYGEEGERLMQELIARERSRVRVRMNEAALADLAEHPPPGLAARPATRVTPPR